MPKKANLFLLFENLYFSVNVKGKAKNFRHLNRLTLLYKLQKKHKNSNSSMNVKIQIRL